jgi:hypothetical protein
MSVNSYTTAKVLHFIYTSNHPVSIKEIWLHVHNDFDDVQQVKDLITNLVIAGFIMSCKAGFTFEKRKGK